MSTTIIDKTSEPHARSQRAIAESSRRIVRAVDPYKVILFGSRAWGDPRPGSDIDLLVIVDSDGDGLSRYREVCQAACIPGIPMDLLVRTPAEIENRVRETA